MKGGERTHTLRLSMKSDKSLRIQGVIIVSFMLSVICWAVVVMVQQISSWRIP